MSDYAQRRTEYINNWPNSEPFPAEQNYQIRCEKFLKKYKCYPFHPMKMWTETDDTFNRAVSHLIDSLDMMPLHPNFAFQFIFSALDFFAKDKYLNNTTSNLKQLINDLLVVMQKNHDVCDVMHALFEVLPVNTSQYLYKCLFGYSNHNSNVAKRIYTDENNSLIPYHKNLLDLIQTRYGYNASHYEESIRQGSLLVRKFFIQDTVTIEEQTISITDKLRAYLLLCGTIYSLRNDAMHGSSMASTKSSLTSPERYASNYYCFLAAYTIFMLALIMKTISKQDEQSIKYAELKTVTLENVRYFKDLFGARIK